jgi:hypothetical protein
MSNPVEVGTVREGPTMRVTFDANVWNRMVVPERHVNSPNSFPKSTAVLCRDEVLQITQGSAS